MMDKNGQDIAYFLSFCVEQYKNRHGLSGADAMKELSRYNVLDYLSTHYEVLHTQSCQWIMEDIDEIVSLRKNRAS